MKLKVIKKLEIHKTRSERVTDKKEINFIFENERNKEELLFLE